MENFTLNNKKVAVPIEWSGVEINAEFKGVGLNSIQPQLSISNFTFVDSAKNEILDYQLRHGKYKQLEMSFNIGEESFKSYLKNYKFLLDRGKIKADAESLDNVSSLTELLTIYSVEMLDYPTTKLDYKVQKKDVSRELLILGLHSLMFSYILQTQIKQGKDYIAKASEAFTPLATGPNYGAIIAYIAEGIALLAFLTSTIINLIKTFINLKELLFPKKRTANCISMYDLLEVPLKALGYTFKTNISDMSDSYIWSSGDGKPRFNDVCYEAIGAFNLAQKKWNGLFYVKDKVVHFYHEEDAFWNTTSNHILPNVELGNYETNEDELIGSRLINYAYDYKDEYTTDDYYYLGTEYFIQSNISDATKSTVKGYEEINYGVARATRKNSLNALEKQFQKVQKIMVKTIKLFGGRVPNTLNNTSLGIAIVSDNNFQIAKMVQIKSGKLVKDSSVNAKKDEENYHWSKSFVRNPKNKHKIYSDLELNYCKNDFINNVSSKYFTTQGGNKGEFESINWNSDREKATVSFRVQDDYKTNLIETFTESLFTST